MVLIISHAEKAGNQKTYKVFKPYRSSRFRRASIRPGEIDKSD
jgi:hypothetical protein